MLREHHRFFRGLNLVGDLVVVAFGYMVSCWVFTDQLFSSSIFHPTVLVLLLGFGCVLGTSVGNYTYRFRRISHVVLTALRQWIVSAALVGGLFLLHEPWMPQRNVLFGVYFFCGIGLIALRLSVLLGLRRYRRMGRSYQRALIVGTDAQAKSIADSIISRSEHGVRIVGFLESSSRQNVPLWRYRDKPLLGSLQHLPRLIREEHLDYVVFAVAPTKLPTVLGAIAICTRMGVPTIVAQEWFARITSRRRAGDFFGQPAFFFETAPPYDGALVFKSILDRSVAALGLLLLLPVFLITAVGIKLTSRGPTFFRQTRVGRNGRRFTMYKFRTMVHNAEELKSLLAEYNEMSGPVFKVANDPRVTRLGRFLRRMSIDELPQLFNVVLGEMSLVGPRPPLPEEVSQYIGTHRRRLSMKPGLTCLWQVGGRNAIDFDEWMKLDLDYIDNWSLGRDAQILMRTIPTVIKGTGAH